jgi:hypothetical protein
MLFLGGLGDEVRAEEDIVPCGGAAIIRIASPIRVTESYKSE